MNNFIDQINTYVFYTGGIIFSLLFVVGFIPFIIGGIVGTFSNKNPLKIGVICFISAIAFISLASSYIWHKPTIYWFPFTFINLTRVVFFYFLFGNFFVLWGINLARRFRKLSSIKLQPEAK